MASVPAPASRRLRARQNYSVDSRVDSYWREFRKRRLVMNNYFAYHRAGRTFDLSRGAPWDMVNEQPKLRLVDERTKHLPQNWDEIYADLDIPALQDLQRRNQLRVGREKSPPNQQEQIITRWCMPIPPQVSPMLGAPCTFVHGISRESLTLDVFQGITQLA